MPAVLVVSYKIIACTHISCTHIMYTHQWMNQMYLTGLTSTTVNICWPACFDKRSTLLNYYVTVLKFEANVTDYLKIIECVPQL